MILKRLLPAFYVCLLGGICLLSQNTSAGVRIQDTVKLKTDPVAFSFQKKLDSLKTANQLEAWLNTWYDYLSEKPSAHYDELKIPIKTIWRKPQTTPEKVAWFYLLIFAGYYELQQGNILPSTDIYEQAYGVVQNTDAVGDGEILEYLIKPLGNNYTRLGDYERAFYIQKEGLKLATKMGDAMQEAASLSNMSTTARWNDNVQEALNYVDQALQKVKQGAALQGLLYSTRADILQEKGKFILAKSDAQKAINLFSGEKFKAGSNSAYWYAGALVTAGDIAQKENQKGSANNYYKKALNILQLYFPQSRQREKMKIQLALGRVSMAESNFEKGVQHFNQVLNGLLPGYQSNKIWPVNSSLYAENTLLDALTGKAKLLHLMGKDSLALAGYQKAALVSQKLREIIFSREAKRLLQEQSLQTTEEAISLAYQLYKKTRNTLYAEIGLQLAEQHKARLLLDDLQQNMTYSRIQNKDSLFIQQNRLRQAVAFFTHSYTEALVQKNSSESLRWKNKIDGAQYELSLLAPQVKKKYPTIEWESTIQAGEIYSHLPKNTIAWEYFTGPNDWYGFTISHKGILQFSWLGEADSLRNQMNHFVGHWFTGGPDAMMNQPQTYFNQAFSIYQKIGLLLPKESTRLMIIPDGILGRLPFEALVTDSKYSSNPAQWSYLLLKAVTSHSYSLSVWYRLQEGFAQSAGAKGFTGFFISPDANSQLATLEGVRREERSIRNILRGQFYKDSKATAAQLFQSVQKDEVIHISTHAFLVGEKQIPVLEMADKRVFLADLYPLHAHPALMVISACQTADGLLSPGEGIISLAREFTAMGAGGVIAGLWSINDETAARLTALFYKELQKSGDKPGSLYQAKRAWLTGVQQSAELKLPYFWAGLVYYGNDQPLAHPLELPNSFPNWGWMIVVVLFFAILAGWLYKKRLKRNKEKVADLTNGSNF